MFRTALWIAPVLALGLMLGYLQLPAAAQDAATGTVTGKVTDADGNAVADAAVRLTARMEGGKKKAEDAPAAMVQDEGGKKKKGPPPAVAEGKTDANGVYTLADVPPGNYQLSVNAGEKGNGRANVTVTAGQTTSQDVKVAPRAPRAKKGE